MPFLETSTSTLSILDATPALNGLYAAGVSSNNASFNNVLEISGSRKSTNISDNKYYKYNERLTGSFKRRFNIKNLINDDNITATSKNGLLEILLPKLEKNIPKEKSIKIN